MTVSPRVIDNLKNYDLVYFATPYSKWEDLDDAANRATIMTAKLMKKGLNIYSPIMNGHAISKTGLIEPLDWKFWIKYNEKIMEKADCFLIGQLPEWHLSKGIYIEYNYFKEDKIPIYTLSEDCSLIAKIPQRSMLFFMVDDFRKEV